MRTNDELTTQIDTVRAKSPQQFGDLRRHHAVLKTALDAAEQNYPTSRQLYEALDDPPLTAQTFGQTLPLLVDFGIISLYTERNSANRYNIREYDTDRLKRLGDLLTDSLE